MKNNRFKKLPHKITIGEKYKPAMEIKNVKEARQYFERLVEHCMSFGKTREEAESIEKQNLGYFAGYYDSDTRLRVEQLFNCAHPIFGKAENGIPTPEEAFEMGKNLVA